MFESALMQFIKRCALLEIDNVQTVMESRTHRRKLTTLDELTSAAVFVASDEGGAITGTILNLTGEMVV